MAQPGRGAGSVQVERRRAMPRQVDVMRLAQRGDLHETGDAAAARHIGLQHVDDRQQPAEIVEIIAVFAGGDIHAGRRARAHQGQPPNVVGADRLLEPGDVVFAEAFGQCQRLLCRKRAVGVDKQTGVADRAQRCRDALRIALGLAADLHLDPATTVALDPAGKLVAQPLVGIAGEAAAAINRDAVAALPEQRGDRDAEQLCLQIPERRIDRRDRGRRETRAPEIAHATPQRGVGARRCRIPNGQ